MNLPFERLQRVLDEPPVPFRLGDYISRGFSFMNANFGQLLAFTLLYFIINGIIQSIPVVGAVAAIVVSPALQIGFYQFTYQVSRGARPDFNDFFKGFSKVGPLTLTYLLMVVVIVLILSPAIYFWFQSGLLDWYRDVMDQYPNIENITSLEENVDTSLVMTGMGIAFVLGISLGILFIWALPIAWFYNVTPWQAVNASRRLVSKYWLNTLLFLLVAGLAGISGALLCGIGLLYTIPAMICSLFFALADITRLLEQDENAASDPIDHFIV